MIETSIRADKPCKTRRSSNGPVAGLLAVLLAVCAGCGDDVYRQIHMNRAAAYSRWDREYRREPGAILKGELAVEDAVAIALANNKQIAAALQEELRARGIVTESYSLALPTVDLEATYTRLDEVESFALNGVEVQFGNLDNYALAAAIRQPLFRAGGIGAGIRAADIFVKISDEETRRVIQEVIYEVSRTYYDILLAEELLLVAEEGIELAQRQLDDVTARRRMGIAADFDVLRAEVEVINLKTEKIQTANRLSLLKASLLRAMGVSQESEIELTGELVFRKIDPSLEEAVKLAYANRPELMQAELSVKLQKENLTAVRSELWPTLDAFFNQTVARPHPRTPTSISWGGQWSAGLVAVYPLFDGFRIRGRIAQAEAELEKSRILLADTEEQILLNVKQSILSVRDAQTLVDSQRANVDRARESYRLAELGYREGERTELELRDARFALLRTQVLHYEAIHQHQMAVLALKRATAELGLEESEEAINAEERQEE